MSDVIDQASEHEEYLREVALQKRATTAPKQESAQWCEDCGQTIPKARRELVKGCVTCVDCQELRELHS